MITSVLINSLYIPFFLLFQGRSPIRAVGPSPLQGHGTSVRSIPCYTSLKKSACRLYLQGVQYCQKGVVIVPHMEKVKQTNINQVLGHDLRSKDTKFKSAVRELESQNRYYLNTGEGVELVQGGNNKQLKAQALEYHKKRLKEAPHTKRKDLVSAVEWVVTCPRDLPTSDRQKFMETAIDFMQNRYGDKNVVAAAMHYDEPGAMPHLHLVFCPVDKRGKVCAKRVMNRAELKQFHPDLERYASRVLGYPVHILRDEDERAKTSLPLSQYKAETIARAAAKQMQNAQGLLKTALEEAEAVAKERYQTIEGTGLIGRMRGNYKDAAKESIIGAERAKALASAELEQRTRNIRKDYEARERSIIADTEHNNRLAAQNEADRATVEEQRRALEEGLRKQAEQAIELQKRLDEANRIAIKAEVDKKEADKMEKAAKADRVAAEQKRAEIAKAAADLAAERAAFDARRKKWRTIEEANEKAEAEAKRADNNARFAQNYRNKWEAEKSHAAEVSSELEKYKDAGAKEIIKQRQVNESLRAEIEGTKKRHEAELTDRDAQISELNNTLEIRNNQLDISMSEAEVLSNIISRKEIRAILTNLEKAQIKAYREQSATSEKEEYMHIEPTERIAALKKQLDRPRGIHRAASSKGLTR